jgi:hypothetical protein
VKTHIIFLGETEEAADLGGSLGAKSLRVDGIGESGKFSLALLDNRQRKDRKVHGDNAAANGFTLALASAAGTIARMADGEEESDSGRVHDTLLHWEALLVVAAGDLEDVAFEFIAHAVAADFGAHTLVHEDTELAFIVDLDELLGAIGRVRDVELHLDGFESRLKSGWTWGRRWWSWW